MASTTTTCGTVLVTITRSNPRYLLSLLLYRSYDGVACYLHHLNSPHIGILSNFGNKLIPSTSLTYDPDDTTFSSHLGDSSMYLIFVRAEFHPSPRGARVAGMQGQGS